MAFQWIEMRITEEQDRRQRESATLQRLPAALEELFDALKECVDSYKEAFGPDSASIHMLASKIRLVAREEVEGKWQQTGRAEVSLAPTLPGFQIDSGTGGEPLLIEVGLLPGEKTYYRDRAADQYVTLEDLTRRVMDRSFFPKLTE